MSPAFTLLKNANLFAPQALGVVDILMAGEQIAAIEPALSITGLPGLVTLDLAGQTVVPGLVDGHVHLIGGGGEGGFATRTPEVTMSKLTTAGVTTVAGLLGTDCVTRHNATLYAKTKGLNAEGITAVMFTGGYTVPSPTITQSIQDDIVFLDTVVGLKLAISDHRSSCPSLDELARMVSDARVAGMVGKKCGRVVVHLGGAPEGLAPLKALLEMTDIPISQFIPTHINRKAFLFEQALDWAKQGGFIDITSGINPDIGAKGAIKPSSAFVRCLRAGLDLKRVCISSDGNGSLPLFDDQGAMVGLGVSGFSSLLETLRELVLHEGIALSDALMPFTQAPAYALGLDHCKGRIAEGMSADLLVLDDNLMLKHTFARGRCMVRDGEAIVRGTFEA